MHACGSPSAFVDTPWYNTWDWMKKKPLVSSPVSPKGTTPNIIITYYKIRVTNKVQQNCYILEVQKKPPAPKNGKNWDED